MKIGVTIPNSWGVEDVSEVIRLRQLAEELGYASVWTMDHLFNIGFVRTRLDDKPYYHPLGILTFLAVNLAYRPWHLGACVAVSQPGRAGEVRRNP